MPADPATPAEVNARATGASSRDAFRWGAFARNLAAIAAVVLVLAAIVLFLRRADRVAVPRTLDERTAALLAANPLTLEIRWPTVTAKDDGASSAPRTWIPLEWQQRLLNDARAILGESANPLDPVVLQSLSASLHASGWFETPPTVRREDGTRIVVTGAWRTPAAVVRHGADEVWITWDAKVMPSVAPAASVNARTIVGPAAAPPRRDDGSLDLGSTFPGADLAAGLELLAVCARQPWFDQVAGIDVSRFTDDASLAILTTQGTRVVFGGRPSAPRFGDAPTRDKLRLLATLYRDTRRIDGGHPTVYVDLPFLMFDRSATAELLRRQEEERLAKAGGSAPPPPSPTPTPPKPGKPVPSKERHLANGNPRRM